MSSNAPVDALVAFGSNLGDARKSFQLASQRLDELDGVSLLAQAKLIETRPVVGAADSSLNAEMPCYQNSVFRIQTKLPKLELFERLRELEHALGRERHERWGPRTIDLDLLLYGEEVLETEQLILPHPRMSFRRFVLEPAAEIAGDMRHPVCGCTIAQLLEWIDQPRPEIGFLMVEGTDLDGLLAESLGRFEKNWRPKKVFLKPDFFQTDRQMTADFPAQGPYLEPRATFNETLWNRFQLVVVMLPQSAQYWMTLKNRFRGPTLLLNPSPNDVQNPNGEQRHSWKREITAAMEAMQSWTDKPREPESRKSE